MPPSCQLIYLITFQSQPYLSFSIEPCLATLGKSGYGKLQPIKSLQNVPTAYLQETDHAIWQHWQSQPQYAFILHDTQGAALMPLLLSTGRCHFVNHRAPALRMGKQQQGQLTWVKEVDGKQRLQCRINGGATTVLPLNPLWYIDHVRHEAGRIQLPIEPDIALHLLVAPAMTAEEIHQIYLLLKETASDQQAQHKLKEYLNHLSAPYKDHEIEHWYCDWRSSTGHKPWFEFEMGISIEGERLNLLPALAELVQTQLSIHGLPTLEKFPDEKTFELKLPHGKHFTISMHRLRNILSILTELYEEDSLHGNEKLRLSRLRALELRELQKALDVPQLQWHGDLSLSTFLDKFRQAEQAPLPTLPKNFQGTLRQYQFEGIRWLQFLGDVGLSGILADDMGLGKTVQILAHLLLEKKQKRSKFPSLIITPTSLVMNWQREAHHFTPSLKLLVLHGQQRKLLFNEIAKYDAIITTYPLLIRDHDILQAQSWHVIVLDEAQYIKNIHSRAGQLVRKLDAHQRLCLTGTPMENHLGELWALFHFLLPGFLGERRQFQRLFRTPIEKENNVERQMILRQRIAPFFLRRTKQQVLPELPEKIEMIRPVTLTETQQELYENLRIVLHEKVLETIRAQGWKGSHIFVLDALLKLRQICCDPRLLGRENPSYDVTTSAKLQLLMELLPHLVEQGRRILVFSQFVQMLNLIEAECLQAKIPYVKLTGQTQQRDSVIQSFQKGDIPLFLISLKAGGVGLNLTAADTVIHYDPWWNPAVENQATDRAHRMGQDKTVFVYKLLTTGTIEDKIWALQQKKQTLLNSILNNTSQPLEANLFDELENLFSPLSTELPSDV